MDTKGLLKVKEMFDDIEVPDEERYLIVDEPYLERFYIDLCKESVKIIDYGYNLAYKELNIYQINNRRSFDYNLLMNKVITQRKYDHTDKNTYIELTDEEQQQRKQLLYQLSKNI